MSRLYLSLRLGLLWKRYCFWVVILVALASTIRYYTISKQGIGSSNVYAKEPFIMPPTYDRVPTDFLCRPLDPNIRAQLAPNKPHNCYKTKFPAKYLELACDFETNGYCIGSTCNFWFNHMAKSLVKDPTPDELSMSDSELSLNIVNAMLMTVKTRFLASLGRLYSMAKTRNTIDRYQEHTALQIAVQACIVVFWHCDESRTRSEKAREASWATTHELLSRMRTGLRIYGTSVGCWHKGAFTSISRHCGEIESILRVFDLLMPELKRRAKWGISQCSVDNRE